MRQPYLRKILGDEYEHYPNVNHMHFFGWYIGNYPGLEQEKILALCEILNSLWREVIGVGIPPKNRQTRS